MQTECASVRARQLPSRRGRTRIAIAEESTISYLKSDQLLEPRAYRRERLSSWFRSCWCSRCASGVDDARCFPCAEAATSGWPKQPYSRAERPQNPSRATPSPARRPPAPPCRSDSRLITNLSTRLFLQVSQQDHQWRRRGCKYILLCRVKVRPSPGIIPLTLARVILAAA